MTRNLLYLSLLVPFISSCSGSLNSIDEFGDARVTADYFLRDYYDFFSYDDKDFVRVLEINTSNVEKGEYLSAINGKFGNSYNFYSVANYEDNNLLIVEHINKLRRIDKFYLYASQDASPISINYFANFPSNDEDDLNHKKVINNITYIPFEEAIQPLERGEEVLFESLFSYYTLLDFPEWIVRLDNAGTQKLLYNLDIQFIDVKIIWSVRDNVIH